MPVPDEQIRAIVARFVEGWKTHEHRYVPEQQTGHLVCALCSACLDPRSCAVSRKA